MQFVRISLAAKYFTARIPAAVQGSFTTMRGCSAASASPSRTIPSKSVAMTSALTSADFNIMTVAVFRTPDVLFGHQRWVGRYAVQDAQFMRLADLFQIGRVDKEFHGSNSFYGFLKIRRKFQTTEIVERITLECCQL